MSDTLQEVRWTPGDPLYEDSISGTNEVDCTHRPMFQVLEPRAATYRLFSSIRVPRQLLRVCPRCEVGWSNAQVDPTDSHTLTHEKLFAAMQAGRRFPEVPCWMCGGPGVNYLMSWPERGGARPRT